jgi:hypothetical protein
MKTNMKILLVPILLGLLCTATGCIPPWEWWDHDHHHEGGGGYYHHGDGGGGHHDGDRR